MTTTSDSSCVRMTYTVYKDDGHNVHPHSSNKEGEKCRLHRSSLMNVWLWSFITEITLIRICYFYLIVCFLTSQMFLVNIRFLGFGLIDGKLTCQQMETLSRCKTFSYIPTDSCHIPSLDDSDLPQEHLTGGWGDHLLHFVDDRLLKCCLNRKTHQIFRRNQSSSNCVFHTVCFQT